MINNIVSSITKVANKPITAISLALLLSLTACQKEGESFIENQNAAIEKNDSISLGDQATQLDSIACEKLKKNEINGAIEAFWEARKIYEQIGDHKGIRRTTKSIGHIYFRQENWEKAKEYFLESLEIAKTANDERSVLISMLHLGDTENNMDNIQESFTRFSLGRTILQNNDSPNIQSLQPNYAIALARYYKKTQEYTKARNFLQTAKEINKTLQDSLKMAILTYDLGSLELVDNKYHKAEQYFLEGLEISKKKKYKSLEERGYTLLKQMYEQMGEWEEAYNFQSQSHSLRNEILNTETSEIQAEMREKYDAGKKESQIQLQQLEIDKQQAENEQQRFMLIMIVSGGLLIIIAISYITMLKIKQHKQSQKDNLEIKRQKQKVDITNTQLIQTNTELDNANQVIKEKSEGITASIRYAKRIQDAILPSDKEIKDIFPDSFVLFKPKDIVSGDFYWFSDHKDGKKYFAAVDCTGHGVPGAFMSLIGNDILSHAMKKGLKTPADILNFLSTSIIDKLNKQGSDLDPEDQVKDAMDISLCAYDEKKQILEYAGAYNPIFIINNDDEDDGGDDDKIKEISADKRQIGMQFDKNFGGYKNNQIHIKPNSIIYLFSDGYDDQFGGDRGKKMKRKKFRKKIQEISKLPIQEQQQILDDYFEKRRGDNEQVDDVLVIAIKL